MINDRFHIENSENQVSFDQYMTTIQALEYTIRNATKSDVEAAIKEAETNPAKRLFCNNPHISHKILAKTNPDQRDSDQYSIDTFTENIWKEASNVAFYIHKDQEIMPFGISVTVDESDTYRMEFCGTAHSMYKQVANKFKDFARREEVKIIGMNDNHPKHHYANLQWAITKAYEQIRHIH